MPYFGAWYCHSIQMGGNPIHNACHTICGEERHVVVVEPLSEVVIEPDFSLIPGCTNVVVEVSTNEDSPLR